MYKMHKAQQEFMEQRGRMVVYMGGHPSRAAIIKAIGDEMRRTIDAHRQQEKRDDAARAGIQPAPLDAPDARVNPAATIRGLK